ncbi:MAG TPA: hypothetical protein VFE62_03750 [Gemmataceae bacterium]|nr:hypothetical protein [Gemmataceae bacterium]
MGEKKPDQGEGSFSHCLNCVDVYLEGPGDRTVRPIPPKLLAQAKELRDRLQAAEAAGVDLSDQEMIIE